MKSLLLRSSIFPRPLRSGASLAVGLGTVALLALACSSEDRRPTVQGGSTEGGRSGDDGNDGAGATNAGGNDGQGGDNVGGEGGVLLSCEGVDCVRGTCDDATGHAVCDCLDGFSGIGCENVNECLEQGLCGDHGTCFDGFGTHYCRCDVGFGWNGSTCVDQNECDSDPCHPDATCTNVANGFSCACDAGKFGNGFFCKSTNSCSGNPCGSHGDCLSTPTGSVCSCDSGYSGATCNTACSTLDLDPALEAIVRARIGKMSGALVPADVADLRDLDASASSVNSLAGLECWPHLQELDLSRTPLDSSPTKMAALGQLNQLKSLDLGCTAITDLDFLAGHPSLRRLVVDTPLDCESALTDVSAVASLHALRELTLSGHDLPQVSALGSLRALVSLNLSRNALDDLEDLNHLAALEQLDVSSNQLADLGPLEDLARLRELDVSFNSITSIQAISRLARLEILVAGSNSIELLPDLSGLESLRQLLIWSNELTSVERIAEIPSLYFIDLTNNQITTLAPFEQSTQRASLFLTNNPLACATERDRVRALEERGFEFIPPPCP